VFGEQDNLTGEAAIVADDAPATHRVPKAGVRRSDADLVAELARRFAEGDAGGGKAKAKGLSTERQGTFQTWAYAHRGLTTLEICLWELPLDSKTEPEEPAASAADAEPAPGEAGEARETPPAATEGIEKGTEEKKPEASDEAKRLIWIDQHANEDGSQFPAGRHLGWQAYDHPDLGTVEIGGFAPFALSEPPMSLLGGIADRQRALVLLLGESLARVSLPEVTARDLGSGLVEVRAVLENDGLLPLVTRSGLRTQTGRPARVKLRVPGDAVLLGGSPQILVPELEGSGGRYEMRWLLRGAPVETIGISVVTDNAGAAQARAEVPK
jgi:hypothetical protein